MADGVLVTNKENIQEKVEKNIIPSKERREKSASMQPPCRLL